MEISIPTVEDDNICQKFKWAQPMIQKFRFSAHTPEKHLHKETFTRMFTAALFVVMKHWQPPKRGKRLNQLVISIPWGRSVQTWVTRQMDKWEGQLAEGNEYKIFPFLCLERRFKYIRKQISNCQWLEEGGGLWPRGTREFRGLWGCSVSWW